MQILCIERDYNTIIIRNKFAAYGDLFLIKKISVGSFSSPEEANDFIRRERDTWE